MSWYKKLWINGFVSAKWLDRDRIASWSGMLLGLEALLFGFMILWYNNVFHRIDPQISTDFVSFYAAGKLALAGTPALAYQRAAHAAAEAAATQPGTPYQFFFYPPVYLFVCAPLALLPYLVAFISFQATTLAAWLVVMRRIIQPDNFYWCLPVLAFPAVFWTVGQGQNAFLTAALIGGATLSLDKRPLLAGVLLGLLCYKPHLAFLMPFVLIVANRWRTIAGAGATVALIAGLSAIIFGTETWKAYLAAFSNSRAVYENGFVDFAGFVTPYGAARVLGAASSGAWLAQAAATVAIVLMVSWIWRRNAEPAVRFVALTSGILLSIPLALVYDMMILTIAMAWLVRASRDGGFGKWEKLALFFCYFVPLVGRDFGHHLHIPILPLAPVALLAIAFARAISPNSRVELRSTLDTGLPTAHGLALRTTDVISRERSCAGQSASPGAIVSPQ